MNSCCSVTKLCRTVCDPMDCSTSDFPVLHYILAFAQIHWVGDAIQPSHPLPPLLLLPSVFPSIRIFSNESALCISWPQYWSLSFSPFKIMRRSSLKWGTKISILEMQTTCVDPGWRALGMWWVQIGCLWGKSSPMQGCAENMLFDQFLLGLDSLGWSRSFHYNGSLQTRRGRFARG